MLEHLKRFLKALFKMVWDILKKRFGDMLKKWALLAIVIGFVAFVAVLLLIWILVAGF